MEICSNASREMILKENEMFTYLLCEFKIALSKNIENDS